MEKAKHFATRAHEGQKRKYTGEPYICHCEQVAELVRSHGGTPEMIAAAWLHDTVEDCGITLDEIEDMFGTKVAEMVSDLTDVSKREDGNRAKRKEIDRLHTAKASPEAKTIKLADLISNTGSITKHDPDFARVYLKEKRLLLQVLKCGNTELYSMAVQLCESFD